MAYQVKLVLNPRFFGRLGAIACLIATAGLVACNPVSLLVPSLKEAPPASDAEFNDEFLPGAPSRTASPLPLPSGLSAPAAATPSPAGSGTPSPAQSISPKPGGGPAGSAGGGVAAPVAPAAETGDPFVTPDFVDITTASAYKPAFSFALLADLSPGASPALETSIYQTAQEVELREARLLLENCQLRYDRFSRGQTIGTVVLDVGTPPKATLSGSLRVTEVGSNYVTVEAKASNAVASAYIADIRFRQVDGHLSIVSIANFSRGNDAQGIHVTERSARVTQRLEPGFLVLPQRPGPFRARALLYGENDPRGGGTPLKVVRNTFTVSE